MSRLPARSRAKPILPQPERPLNVLGFMPTNWRYDTLRRRRKSDRAKRRHLEPARLALDAL